MRKKKVVIHTDSAAAKTGFGRHAKGILKYLHGTEKFDIVQYCCSLTENDPTHKLMPWKSLGCLPDDPQMLQALQADPNRFRKQSYGEWAIDKVIQNEKPDVYIGIQDIWGVDYCIDKPWFSKINSVIWTTLDSLPILPLALEKAKDIKNYWIWSNFATKAMHREGHTHVKTMHGSVETKYFHRLPARDRKKLRARNGIEEDAFVIGFVFRNQGRKSVDKLMQGYQKWIKENSPKVKTYLLLHTSFSEGWPIQEFANRYGIPQDQILTTLVCKNCKEFEVKAFEKQDSHCKHCGKEDGMVTTSVRLGVTETHLNDVYNLMDFYAHPFNSGGQEIPIQEAKLAGLITGVTNYSCGCEMAEDPTTIPFSYTETIEVQTNFIKAVTDVSSIASAIEKVFSMSSQERESEGAKARKWAIEGFSVKSVGQKVEAFLDKCELVEDYDFDFSPKAKDPNAVIDPSETDLAFVKQLYEKILMTSVAENDPGLAHWIERLSKDLDRDAVEKYFRRVASEDNEKNKKIDFEDILGNDDKGKRILYVIPESLGDVYLSTAIIQSLKEVYSDFNIYVGTKPENMEILKNNPDIFKVLPYIPEMDSQIAMTGRGKNQGFFEISFHGYLSVQRHLDYLGDHRIELKIN
jgi:hypothetical protein